MLREQEAVVPVADLFWEFGLSSPTFYTSRQTCRRPAL